MTYDESAHLYAGYQHWTARDFGVNPEHPPLAKLVAALPLLGMKIKPSNPQRFLFLGEEYAGGEQMLGTNGNYQLLIPALIAASFSTFALALLVFAAGWAIFGPTAGLLALMLSMFEPTNLAYGALVTADMLVACSIFAAVYAFYRYSSSELVEAGVLWAGRRAGVSGQGERCSCASRTRADCAARDRSTAPGVARKERSRLLVPCLQSYS